MPLPFTKLTRVFNVKRELKSLHTQTMIFHVPLSLQMLQISFFIQHCISKANRSPDGCKLHTDLFSSAQCHEDERW